MDRRLLRAVACAALSVSVALGAGPADLDYGVTYAIQVTTDSPHWGGLSGSTLAEAQSWGKVNKKANHNMAFVEPSVSLPLIYGYALQKKLHKNRPRLDFKWSGDELKELKIKK